MCIRKRYSEFDALRRQLVQTFPQAGASLPPLPPKSVVNKFRPKFLEHRRVGLQYFLKYNPSESDSRATADQEQLCHSQS